MALRLLRRSKRSHTKPEGRDEPVVVAPLDPGDTSASSPPQYTPFESCDAKSLLHTEIVRKNFHESASIEEFEKGIIALIKYINAASLARKMEACMVNAVEECLKAGENRTGGTKETLPSDNNQRSALISLLHKYKVDGGSLPSFIILHASPDLAQELRIRHSLLDLLLKRLPLTLDVRDELYAACAKTGFNCFFRRVRQASLQQLQVPSTIPGGLSEVGTVNVDGPLLAAREDVIVIPVKEGFQVKWFIPNLAQKLQADIPVGIEFVAQGQVWGLYLRTQRTDRNVEMALCIMKPSVIEGVARLSVTFSKSGTVNSSSSSSPTTSYAWCTLDTMDLPTQGTSPKPRRYSTLQDESLQSVLPPVTRKMLT